MVQIVYENKRVDNFIAEWQKKLNKNGVILDRCKIRPTLLKGSIISSDQRPDQRLRLS